MKKILLLLVVLALVACQVPVDDGKVINDGTKDTTKYEQGTYVETKFDIADTVKTSSFQSLEEYEAFVKSHEGGDYYGGVAMDGMMRGDVMMVEQAVAESMDSAPTAMPVAKGAGADYSETNIQVAGVDEADIIKTDGEYIYTVSSNNLFIIKAYPGEDAEIVSEMKFKSKPSGIFINGDTLAVFGRFNDIEFFRESDFTPRHGMTYFKIYDISDKENPELEKDYKFEGNYFNARMVGNYVYFVLNQQPEYRPIWPTPVLFDGMEPRAMPVEDIFYFDIPYRNPNMVTVHSVNLDSYETNSKSIMAEYGQNMYMSHENLFITYTEYVNEWDLRQDIQMELLKPYLTDSDKALVEKIKLVDNDVMSYYDKKNKIRQIHMAYLNYISRDEQDELEDETEEILKKKLEDFKYFEFTVINKIAYDNGKLSVEANGKVPGHVINQFSMDEHDGVFRIATTINRRWDSFGKERTESTNNIYTLDEDMEVLDALEGLAEGESIYSTRFMGDMLYMVTFRQVDPFFVIDLSNPRNIKELGELKIPGFSRYLHPYDENTIIGLGQEATETGRTTGLKISLFDVSDFENPKEIAKFVTEQRYAQSSAMYEHKAFLFSKEKELLVIPAYSSDHETGEGYNGAFVFHITRDEIELRGLIDHSKGVTFYQYGPNVERSLYIEELLYTKSPNLLRINEIDDLSSVKDIKLKGSTGDIPVY
ncbi:beta-propeller domain-containing protein [Nanoarchaeota archaeon]